MKTGWLALIAALALIPASAQAQSFNCRYARSADEVLICQSPRLAALDERLSGLYFRVRNRLYGRARAALEADQADWLAGRRACGRDAGCVASAYQRRIAELQDY